MALHPRDARVGQVLLSAGVVDSMQLRSAAGNAEQWGRRLACAVVDMRLATEQRVIEALGTAFKVTPVNLETLQAQPGALARLDPKLCESRVVFPVAEEDGGKTLVLAMADPLDLDAVDFVGQSARARVKPVLAGQRAIEKAIGRWYRGEEQAAALTPVETPALDELDELKLVDIHGKTLMVDGATMNLKEQLAEALGEKKKPPPPAPAPRTPAQIVVELEQRIAQLQHQQETMHRWLRASFDLMVEKGLATPDEIRARLSR